MSDDVTRQEVVSGERQLADQLESIHAARPSDGCLIGLSEQNSASHGRRPVAAWRPLHADKKLFERNTHKTVNRFYVRSPRFDSTRSSDNNFRLAWILLAFFCAQPEPHVMQKSTFLSF